MGVVGKLSPSLEEIFPIWRIWKETNTPLKDIMEHWTYEEVMQANAILDMYSDNEMARNALLAHKEK